MSVIDEYLCSRCSNENAHAIDSQFECFDHSFDMFLHASFVSGFIRLFSHASIFSFHLFHHIVRFLSWWTVLSLLVKVLVDIFSVWLNGLSFLASHQTSSYLVSFLLIFISLYIYIYIFPRVHFWLETVKILDLCVLVLSIFIYLQIRYCSNGSPVGEEKKISDSELRFSVVRKISLIPKLTFWPVLPSSISGNEWKEESLLSFWYHLETLDPFRKNKFEKCYLDERCISCICLCIPFCNHLYQNSEKKERIWANLYGSRPESVLS